MLVVARDGRSPGDATQIAAFIDKLPGYLARLQSIVSDPSRPWLAKVFGGGCPPPASPAGPVTQSLGWVTAFLASLWSGGRAVFSVLSLLDHHAGRRVLSAGRLGPRGGDGRRLDSAAAPRHGARPGPRHRQRDRGLRARPGGDLPDPRGVLRHRTDADRAQVGLSDRADDRAVQLHSLRRRARRISRRGHRRDRAVLAGLDADRAGGRRVPDRPGAGRLRAVAQARRRQGRPASGLADVCADRVRLSVRLRGPSDRHSARSRDRRAGALFHRQILESPVYTGRQGRADMAGPGAIATDGYIGSRPSSRSRSIMPKALRARISSPAPPTPRRWR